MGSSAAEISQRQASNSNLQRPNPQKQQCAASQARLSQRVAFSERRRGSILVGQRSVDLLMDQTPGEKGPRFAIFVIRQYRRWGYFVAEHDWKFILLCLIITLFGLIKVFLTPQQNDITGYTPYGARALEEYTRYQEFFSEDGPGIAVYIFALAKDDGSMLRDSHLKETVNILNIASDDVTLFNTETGTNKSFSQFCKGFCQANEPVRQFYAGFKTQMENLKRGEKLNGRIELNYPVTKILGQAFTLQQSFFGLEFYSDNGQAKSNQFDVNKALLAINANNVSDLADENELTGITNQSSNAIQVSNMKEVKMLVLQFRAEHQDNWRKATVKKYELDMVQRFEREYNSENLKLFVYSQSYAETEMVRAGISLLPYLTVGFSIMAICAICSVIIRAVYMQQHSPPKILLAIAACCLPFMSCATSLGIMFQFGMRFASILCVIPFLVLSIGVDSSYLMIHEWQREIKHCRNNPNRKNANVGYRVSRVLSEVGPAVLISTLTNIFADGMGTFTSSPEITLLCLGNLASMMVSFFYQITFYAGLMSLVGRYEILSERKERQLLQESLRRSAYSMEFANGKSPLTRQESKFIENTKFYASETMFTYVEFMAKKGVALIVIIIYFIYLGISIWGICWMNINLSSQKLFLDDSPLLALDKLRVVYQLPHFTMATVFVSNPGNLSDPARLKRMNDFVQDMEAINGSWGPVGTQYFVRDFIAYESAFHGEIEPPEFDDTNASSPEPEPGPEGKRDTSLISGVTETPMGPFDETDLKTFIAWPEDKHWKGFLKLDNKTGVLRRFFFTTAYQGKRLSIWTERGKLLGQWRSVVDKYSEFNASVFHEDSVFLDLIDNMPTDTWQSVLGTLIAMAIICFLFLNSLFTVVMASGSVLSIVAGILGILSWWNIDLDPITMAAMIISIGFSVDIPAHVSYHYYQASVRELNASPQIKLVNCLSSVAFPALQAALSTTLCVCSLLFVKLYMAEVFVKTMVLCVALCNIHGLIFLPAFLIVFDDVLRMSRRRLRSKQRVAVATNKYLNHPPVGRISEEGSIQESIKKDGSIENTRTPTPTAIRNGYTNGYRKKSTTPAPASIVPDRPILDKHFSEDNTATDTTPSNPRIPNTTGPIAAAGSNTTSSPSADKKNLTTITINDTEKNPS